MFTRCGFLATDLPVLYPERKLEKRVREVLEGIERKLLAGEPSGFYEGLTYKVIQSSIGKAVLVEEGE